jgi:hypothetical protein
MSTEQNDVTTEQKKIQKEKRKHLETIYWAGVLIWVGLVFGAENLGILPQIGGAEAWSWIFFGAGLYALLMALFRIASPDYSNPTAGDYIWAGVLIIIGLSGLTTLEISWPLILVLVGIVILGNALLRRN